LVPLILLGLQFLLKLVVFERPGPARVWESLIQVPVDVAFLAVSFLAASVIVPSPSIVAKVVLFLLYLGLTALTITLWKGAPADLNRGAIKRAAGLTILNFAITLTMLVGSIAVLLSPSK
jgi:hypothetical protein